MQPRRFYLTICVILTFIFAASGLAGAGILDKASQLFNIMASSNAGSTSVPLSAFKQVNPDGSIGDFNPQPNVVVVTKVLWRFKPDGAQTNAVQLKLASAYNDTNYFYGKKNVVGADGYAADNDNITPGIPVNISNASAYAFYVVDLGTGNAISGSLVIRLTGYLTPNQ
jgi:hypothetical protein